MLCAACRCQLSRRAAACGVCGKTRPGAPSAGTFSLVLADGTRAPVRGELTVGRAAGNRFRLDDPAVSRRHAELVETAAGIEVRDLGSSSGTFVDGHRVRSPVCVRDGQRLRLGDTRLLVERDRDEREAARTIFVPEGRTLLVDAQGRARGTAHAGATEPVRPRLRSGWARKRLDAGEGDRRFIVKDLRSNRFLRLGEDEARLLERLDGRLTVAELTRAVAAEDGIAGVRRLLALLAELGELGLLASGGAPELSAPKGWRRLMRPRELSLPRLPERAERLYRAGGFALYSRAGLALLAAVLVAGAAAFAVVIARGGVRPFHVADGVVVGGVAFTLGRLAVVALHELGHALTLASFGRRARTIGVKLVLIFPYAFVDTSEAWFEPRRRRLAVSGAGPLTDALVAGAFSLAALVTAGIARDVSFQLALGAYLGMLMNLNPLLERDGYHLLEDVLREPSLRRRAREHLTARVAGRRGDAAVSRAVALYGVATLAWSGLAACFAGGMARRFAGRVTNDAAFGLGLAAAAATVALIPVVLLVVPALRLRRRSA